MFRRCVNLQAANLETTSQITHIGLNLNAHIPTKQKSAGINGDSN